MHIPPCPLSLRLGDSCDTLSWGHHRRIEATNGRQPDGLAVVCSDPWGGQAMETYRRTGRTLDLMNLGGGGIHGHPMGAAAGVRAIRQASRAAELDVELDDRAKDQPELASVLAKWSRGGAAGPGLLIRAEQVP